MRVITVAAQKGGTGKSTLCVHLAVEAAGEGLAVAIIDADPQGSVRQWAVTRGDADPLVIAAAPEALAATLKGLSADVVFIDTAPAHGADITSAARLSDLVLVPARPAVFDVRAVAPTVRLARAVRRQTLVVLNQTPPQRGKQEPTITREARELLEAGGATVATTAIAQRADLQHALISSQAVQEFAPTGKAASEIRTLWREIWHALN